MEIYRIFDKWGNPSEVWVYKYGSLLLGALSTLSAAYINYHFRNTLYLLNYQRMTSYMLMFFAPGVTAGATHYMSVTSVILEDKTRHCPICLQVRGMTLQGFCSIGYPLILVPVIWYPVAKRLQNDSVPNISLKNKYPVIQFTREMLRPIRGQLWAIGAVQVAMGLGITYLEQNNYFEYVKPKLAKHETLHSHRYFRPEADENENPSTIEQQ